MQDAKIQAIDSKVDRVDEKVDKLGHHMALLLAHLGVGGDGKSKARTAVVKPLVVRSPPAQQADVQVVLGRRADSVGLRDGIVESDVIFTLAAAAEIRSTVQELVESATGVCVGSTACVNLSADIPMSISPKGSPRKDVQSMQLHSWNEHTPHPRPKSPLKSKGSFMDGTMSDSDSSDNLSPRRLMRRPLVVNTNGDIGSHTVTTNTFVKTVRSERVKISRRDSRVGVCEGVRERARGSLCVNLLCQLKRQMRMLGLRRMCTN